jgi:predicted glycosyltransferase
MELMDFLENSDATTRQSEIMNLLRNYWHVVLAVFALSSVFIPA